MTHETPETAADTTLIHRLPTRLINQIAAGEVVTRPAAALKELIENSLDAGARRIEVTVLDDALSFSVRDDGLGMAEADLHLAIERYATSKIREFEDLSRLTTRGFRGEALAAISAVSRLEIITRRRGEAEGCRLKVSGGLDPHVAAAGAPEGTTIHVRDLFYNTPVRLKFLKNAVAEWGHMLQAIVRQSLTRPDVAFAIRWRGKPYLDLPADQPLKDRLAQILPGGGAVELLELDCTLHEARVHGAVTSPRFTRRDRRHQFFFVNERPILFRPLPFALEEAYKGLIMTQQYPMGAILIEVPSEMVDVNVHPTKEEVRFHNEALVTGAVHRAVVEALRAADLVPRLQVPVPGEGLRGPIPPGRGDLPAMGQERSFQSGGQKAGMSGPAGAQYGAAPSGAGADALRMSQDVATGAAPDRSLEHGRQIDFVSGFGLGTDKGGNKEGAGAAYAEPAAQEEAGLIGKLRGAPSPPRALAQISDTYILADGGPLGMLVIDQHAAHEKILYLKFMRQAEEAGMPEVQPLMVPHSIEVAPVEAAALESILPGLRQAGFDVDPFGGGTFIVQAIPVLFDRLDVPAFLRDLIDDVGQGDLPREMRRLRERICARAACRAAVKSGDDLSLAEMQRLVDELMHTAEALRCPHGRPTVLLLTREHIDHQFGRI